MVVVQSDAFNRSRLRTVVGVAVTTNLRLAAMPGNVLLPSLVSGLPKDSVANVTQLATLDRGHLASLVGHLPRRLMADVDRGLRLVLGLAI